jgi:hypothetical protein
MEFSVNVSVAVPADVVPRPTVPADTRLYAPRAVDAPEKVRRVAMSDAVKARLAPFFLILKFSILLKDSFRLV